MQIRGRGLLVAATLLLFATLSRAAPDFIAEQISDDARYAASWVLDAADHQGRPFAIVDKRDARIYVFNPDGRLLGASPALLGAAVGDFAVGAVEGRSPASFVWAERTTPAGRFASEPGHNDKGEPIVWVDYAASLAIHRLRPSPPYERRAARLDSPTPDDNRISSGCVVVPVAFYESVIAPTLGTRRGVVYVLPESKPVQAAFGTVEVGLRAD